MSKISGSPNVSNAEVKIDEGSNPCVHSLQEGKQLLFDISFKF